MAAEANLVRRVLRELNSWPQTRAIKMHGSAYTRQGAPDIQGCTHGRMFVIEVKSKGKTPTKIQHYELRQWELAGAEVGWTDTFEGAVMIARRCQTSMPA